MYGGFRAPWRTVGRSRRLARPPPRASRAAGRRAPAQPAQARGPRPARRGGETRPSSRPERNDDDVSPSIQRLGEGGDPGSGAAPGNILAANGDIVAADGRRSGSGWVADGNRNGGGGQRPCRASAPAPRVGDVTLTMRRSREENRIMQLSWRASQGERRRRLPNRAQSRAGPRPRRSRSWRRGRRRLGPPRYGRGVPV